MVRSNAHGSLGLKFSKERFLTRTNFIREGLPKGGHSSTHTRDVPFSFLAVARGRARVKTGRLRSTLRARNCSPPTAPEWGGFGSALFPRAALLPSSCCLTPQKAANGARTRRGFRPRAAQCRQLSSCLHRGLRTLPRRACHRTRQVRRRDRRLHRYLRRLTLQLRRRRLHHHDHRPCAHHLTSRRPRRRLCQVLHLCLPSSRRPRRRRHFLLPRRLRGSPTLAT